MNARTPDSLRATVVRAWPALFSDTIQPRTLAPSMSAGASAEILRPRSPASHARYWPTSES